ncbi:uncharacterized protein A4U43_C06F7620 [Asparagus officinalis]|uniref:Subtilisin-like protease fibronectin type-III domain-containing protein n=1 Tax=Asparagus officinalis TaxID=4686 RepID=A0A5P1EL66_ASPOF|nr:uncharacterized protein A4U43_C06F7620 [Asparagus officinalis]
MEKQVSVVAKHSINCSTIDSRPSSELNYPSIMVTLNDRNDYKVVVTRTMTNVGAPDSMYAVNITALVGPTHVAIGAFSAVKRGIFVSFAMGNDGPGYSTLSNEAPWILTVGESTTDRSIRTIFELGNEASFDGQSAYQPSNFSRSPLPLVYPSLLNQSARMLTPGPMMSGLKNVGIGPVWWQDG